MRECLRRRAGEIGKLLALALVIMACAVPVSADAAASRAVVPDRLFNTSLAASASDFPSFGTELVLTAEESGEGLAFAAVPYAADTLNLLTNGQDNRSESGGEGVRRFILLAILFGGALRFLTSPVFYDWAADVFDPLDGY